MDTAIRKGKAPFYGDKIFSHGLSRSGYFNKRESDELLMYGATLSALADGSLLPENDDEHTFVDQISTAAPAAYYPAKLWQKYCASVEKSKVHHGFAKSSAKSTLMQGNEMEFA